MINCSDRVTNMILLTAWFCREGTNNQYKLICNYSDIISRPTEGATLLHLREALSKQAEDRRRAESSEAVFNAFQARFRLSARQALSRLSTSDKAGRHSSRSMSWKWRGWYALRTETSRTTTETIWQWKRSVAHWGTPSLQRHLLAVPTPTLADVVRTGNDYL